MNDPQPEGHMASHIGRRKFLATLGGAAAAWPLAARAQQSIVKARRLGMLLPGAPPEPLVEALLERLRELGYREGRDVVFELRWAQGKNERLTELASELVAAKVDVLTTISTPAALAARKVTTTIPIVFTGVGDPVGAGVVPSLSHPDGNATGLSLLATELSAKRLELLREIVPTISRVSMLWNDTNPSMVLRAREANDAAAKLGIAVQSVGVHDLLDFDRFCCDREKPRRCTSDARGPLHPPASQANCRVRCSKSSAGHL